jgi:hypothetical protein
MPPHRAARTSDLIKRRAVLAAVKTAPPTAVAFGQSSLPLRAARSNLQAGTEKPRSSRTEKLQKSLWNTSALLCGCVTVLRIK